MFDFTELEAFPSRHCVGSFLSEEHQLLLEGQLVPSPPGREGGDSTQGTALGFSTTVESR